VKNRLPVASNVPLRVEFVLPHSDLQSRILHIQQGADVNEIPCLDLPNLEFHLLIGKSRYCARPVVQCCEQVMDGDFKGTMDSITCDVKLLYVLFLMYVRKLS